MARLPFGLFQLTPRELRIKDRAKQVGAGVPDIAAPSAYEVSTISEDLARAAGGIYVTVRNGRAAKGAADPQAAAPASASAPDFYSRDEAERIAAAEGRRFLDLAI